jgi:transcriptional regulator with XRE-family HTH domain
MTVLASLGDHATNPVASGPARSVGQDPQLALPTVVARALRNARHDAGLSLEEVARACGVTSAVVAELEAGKSHSFHDARSLLTTLERVAINLGLSHDVVLSATLRAWSSAYSEDHEADREAHDGPRLSAPVTTQIAASAPETPTDTGYQGASVPTLMVQSLGTPSVATEHPSTSAPHRTLRERALVSDRTASAPRVLRRAIWLVAAGLLVASGMLAAVDGGLLGRSAGHRLSVSTPSTSLSTLPAKRGSLLTEISASTDKATFWAPASTYRVTISADRPSWVALSPDGRPPIFAGIIEPGAIHDYTESGSVTVEVGAGGTTVSVSAGGRLQSLMAPVAPYTYLFQSK